MGWERTSTDDLQRLLVSAEEERSRLAAVQLEVLEELDRRQVHTGDGCRTLGEWVGLVLDTTLEDARGLVRLMRRTADRPDLRGALSDGVSFRRVEALSRIPEDLGLGLDWDVAGLFREAARKARLSATEEVRSVDDRFLVLQPSLDDSSWRLWGGVDAYAGEVIDKTLTELADQLPEVPGEKRLLSAGWKKATALVELCMGAEAPQVDVSVFVTAREAAETDGEAGVVLESGVKVGRRALEAVLCGDTATQVYGITEHGEYMRYGRRHRLATKSQTKALFHKYGGRCGADGCNSRHRLQAHHLRPWSQGGETNLEDMILLCWFHHHVVVHQWGYEIYRHPDHGRIRFRKPTTRGP